MKHMQLFFCLLFATATHCMENNLWKTINCKAVEDNLRTDYHYYLKNRLEEYKKTDFTTQDIRDLCSTGPFITGNIHIGFPYNAIRDDQGNNFIKVATQKQDLPFINWHVKQHGAHCIPRDDFDACLATCIQYLKPKQADELKPIAYEILKTLTIKQGPNASIFVLRRKSCREHLIKQLIRLQLKHKKHGSNFVIEDDVLIQHLTSGNNDQSPIVLADMYQKITNKYGNTLSHLVVQLQNSDELCELINKNYVSPETNKLCKTVLDIALNHFQSFTHDISNVDIYPEQASQARCCLFMLLKYIKSKQSGELIKDYNCCDKHVIKI